MIATITDELYRVNLNLTDGPSIIDAFGGSARVTALSITYSNGTPTAVRFASELGRDLFIDPMDMQQPDSWPTWLRTLVKEHQPTPHDPRGSATSKITSEQIVGEHTVNGRRVQVQRTTWSGTDRLSYDLIDPDTDEVLTMEESFDSYPTDEQIRAALDTRKSQVRPRQSASGACSS